MNCREQSVLFRRTTISRLSDSNGIKSFPVAAEIGSISALQELQSIRRHRNCHYRGIPFHLTGYPVRKSSPDNYDIQSGEELQIKVRTQTKKVYYHIEYGETKLSLANTDDRFCILPSKPAKKIFTFWLRIAIWYLKNRSIML